MAKAMGVKVGNSLRKLVLIKLADNANDKGECWPSYQHIADHANAAERLFVTILMRLKKWGLSSVRTASASTTEKVTRQMCITSN
jgi:hypothetical protein